MLKSQHSSLNGRMMFIQAQVPFTFNMYVCMHGWTDVCMYVYMFWKECISVWFSLNQQLKTWLNNIKWMRLLKAATLRIKHNFLFSGAC